MHCGRYSPQTPPPPPPLLPQHGREHQGQDSKQAAASNAMRQMEFLQS